MVKYTGEELAVASDFVQVADTQTAFLRRIHKGVMAGRHSVEDGRANLGSAAAGR